MRHIARPLVSRRQLLLAALALPLLACANEDDDAAPDTSPTNDGTPATREALRGRLTVFAASSLTDAFTAIAAALEREHSALDVECNFASSSALATQVEQGAPADVFASADDPQMQRVARQGLLAGEAVTFARNVLVIAARSDGSPRIDTPRDLARPGARIVLAARDVPIGAYARQALARLGTDPAYGAAYERTVLANVVSEEANVRAVLAKVELGEADAGIVYATDARSAGARVRAIAIPEAANVVAIYPIATLRDARNPAAAAAFVAYVTGPAGQQLLQDAGFLTGGG
jgi:molybdate transport system substrate-binding protein